jgi:hypothetical protein
MLKDQTPKARRSALDVPAYIVPCMAWRDGFSFVRFVLLNLWTYLMKVIPETCRARQAAGVPYKKICTWSLTHNVSSLEDDNVFVFCVEFF